jgi:MFS transporter, Spinster family, sphingosine-1-phosphate transporter
MSEPTGEKPTTPKPASGAGIALALLLVINLLNYIDRQLLAAVEPPLSAEFGLNESQAGLLASAFLYAYMVGAPILGRLAERTSRWLIVGASVLIWSLASGWTGYAYSYGVLLLTRVLVGFGEAGYGPAAPALIADYFPVERRGKVMALFYLAIPVGSALGYVIGGKVNELWGWRHAFHLAVIPGLILAVVCFMRKDPRPVRVQTGPQRSIFQDAKTLLKIPSYALNTAAMTAMTFAIGGISFWIPKYMLQRQAAQQGLAASLAIDSLHGAPSAATVAKLNSLLSDVNFTFGVIVVIAGILSTFMGGWLADKLRPRWSGAYFAISGVAIALAFPCTLLMTSLPFPYAWYAVFGAVFFLFFNTGPANTALANVTSSRMRATAFAVNIFFIHALGDAISPPLVGWVKNETSWETAFTLVSLMMVLASALWLMAAKHLGRDSAAAEAMDAADATPEAKH